MTGRRSLFGPIKYKKHSKRIFLIYESQHFRFVFLFLILESDSYRAAVSFVVSLSVNNFHCCHIWVDNWIAMPLKPIQFLVWSRSLFWILSLDISVWCRHKVSWVIIILCFQKSFFSNIDETVWWWNGSFNKLVLSYKSQLNKGTQCLCSFCLWQCSHFIICGFRWVDTHHF